MNGPKTQNDRRNERDRIAGAIRQVISRHAGTDMLEPDAVRTAAEQITAAFAEAGIGDGTGLEDLPSTAARAVARMKQADAAEIAQFLRVVADLTEGGPDRPENLEELANWLEANVAPILSDDFGPRAEADRRRAYRDGARGVVGAALARRGIGTGGATAAPMPRPAAAGMARHRLFWRNFASLAPGLARLAATRGGAAAAAAQVADLLRALDLPDEVAVRAGPAGVVLDFAAPPDLDTARVLQRMLADAPVLDGWRLAIGGTET